MRARREPDRVPAGDGHGRMYRTLVPRRRPGEHVGAAPRRAGRARAFLGGGPERVLPQSRLP